ncbi:hypothetical protein T492DRAFT_1144185, partial [Pavlovales sp. CCMP2436]
MKFDSTFVHYTNKSNSWLPADIHGMKFESDSPWRLRQLRRKEQNFSERLIEEGEPAVAGGGGSSGWGVGGEGWEGGAVVPTGCRIEDVFFWAVLMGDTALADVLWRFSHSHLRLALLAADIYTKMATISEQGRKHRDEIEPMRVYWETVATELLEAIRPA